MVLVVRFIIGVGGTHGLGGVCIEVVMVFFCVGVPPIYDVFRFVVFV